MKKKVLETVFFCSWLLCGCSAECMFDSPKNTAVTVVAAIVAIACAMALGHRE